MVARPTSLWYRRKLAWQFLFCLTLFAFLCRAYIPAGYMPTASDGRTLPFAVTLCSSGGPQIIKVLSADGQRHGDGKHEILFENCPFGLTVAYKFLPGGDRLPPVAEAAFKNYVSKAPEQTALIVRTHGPPLGSRAPPTDYLLSLFT